MSEPIRQLALAAVTEDQPSGAQPPRPLPRDDAGGAPRESGFRGPSAEVVIVTRNSRAALERSLDGIRVAAAAADANLLFVDRGSTDGTRAFIASHCPGAQAVWLEESDKLVEVLTTAASCSDADVLLVMRPTVAPSAPDTIGRLVTHLGEHPYAAVAAPVIRARDGSLLESARPRRNGGDYASVEWVLDEMVAIRRTELDAVLNSWRRLHNGLSGLDFFATLRRRGREIHQVRTIELLDTAGDAARRLERATRITPPIFRLLARHPRYAWRLLGRRGTAHLLYRLGRRLLDVVVSSALLILLAPVMTAIALAIRLDSPGPALFRQRRLGRDARRFDMYKFRTMRADADPTPHAQFVHKMIVGSLVSEAERETQVFKVHPDPRVTRVGRLLRRSSFDELPQLFNVLRGEMTLVGFRPPLPYEVDNYPDWYFRRFDGKPGLTGLWQVSGRNERSYEEMVRLDIEYANRRGWLLDLSVLARTVGVVVTGRGAY